MKENILISLKNIVVEFDGQRILKGINLDIHDEDRGKSTSTAKKSTASHPTSATSTPSFSGTRCSRT